MLTKAQIEAIAHVRQYAKARKSIAKNAIDHILRMSNISRTTFDDQMNSTKLKTRVAFHFHPDRLDLNLKSVAEALFESGIYKSQFETLISSGSVSAHPGGDRDLWEQSLFGGAYQQTVTDNSQRPKYGALDLLSHPDGPSPRFGSCYFLLKPEVTKRCTFTYLDSHLSPKEQGTFDEFEEILASLLSDSFGGEVVLGEQLRPTQLLDRFTSTWSQPFENRFLLPHRRVLDHYIEAQVHGTISLDSDVDYLVADPSFDGTETGQSLERLCTKFGISLHWHSGFNLYTSDVPVDFRGPTMPSLAKRVAPDGILTAQKIGEAAASVKRNPSLWANIGNETEVLQELKLLWHVLLRFGHPGPFN